MRVNKFQVEKTDGGEVKISAPMRMSVEDAVELASWILAQTGQSPVSCDLAAYAAQVKEANEAR